MVKRKSNHVPTMSEMIHNKTSRTANLDTIPTQFSSEPPAQQLHMHSPEVVTRNTVGRLRTISDMLHSATPHPIQQSQQEDAFNDPPYQSLSTSQDDSSSTSKRGRGKAKGSKDWGTNVKMTVQFDELFNPLKPNGPRLKTQLGIMVRNSYRVPLTFIDWNAVNDHIKEDIWREVKDNLEICPDGFKETCMEICHKIWKDNKNKIKFIHYTRRMKPPYVRIPEPDIALKGPEFVDPAQWKQLVEYWVHPDIVAQAETNSKNRKERGPPHNTGRTHFSQIRNDMAIGGERLDKMNVFIKTRRADDPEVIRILAEYERRLGFLNDDEKTIEARDQNFHEIVGKDVHGYCRTYGSGVPHSLVYPNNSSQSQTAHASFMAEMEQRITARVTADIESRMTHQFNSKLQEMQSQMLANMECRGSTSRQVADASSGHGLTRESIGDDESPLQQPSLSPRQD